MNNRFLVAKMYICPFIVINDVNLVPDFNNYPERDCVIDLEKDIVVDIDMELQYKYCKVPSRLFLYNEFAEEIKAQQRLALYSFSIHTVEGENLEKSKTIIENLSNGVRYLDGNIISNEDYLNKIKKEEDIKVKQKKLI